MSDNNENNEKSQEIYGNSYSNVISNIPQNSSLSPEIFLDDNIPPDQEIPPEYIIEKRKNNTWIYFVLGLFGLLCVGVFITLLYLLFFDNNIKQNPNILTQQITLTWWGPLEEKEIYSKAIAEYEKRNPLVKISYEKNEKKGYRELLDAKIRNGKGPDIFMYHNTWLRQIKDISSTMPEDMMTEQQFSENFYPVHKKDLVISGKIYGLPAEIDGLMLLYNPEILKQNNILSPPRSWTEDLQQVAKTITTRNVQGAITISGIGLGTSRNISYFSDILTTIIMQNKGNYYAFSSKEAKEGISFYTSFYEKGIWDETLPDTITAFSQGKVAMIFAPATDVNKIKELNPDIQVRITQVPRSPNGNTFSLASYWAYGVSASSQNQLESWKFLNFLSSPEVEQLIFAEQSKNKLVPSAYARKSIASLMLPDQYLGPILQQAPFFETAPMCDNTLDSGINDYNIRYVSNMITSIIENKDANQSDKKENNPYEIAEKGITDKLKLFGYIEKKNLW